jgi:hypothetical protein
MSSTLTWQSSGLGTKTGITSVALINDLVSLFASKAGDANFSWTVASSNNSSDTPYYIVLKRKNGSAGRILLMLWGTAPSAVQPKLYDAVAGVNGLNGTYFPAGNVDTPSNLNAALGTILGDDTGVMKIWPNMNIGTVYGASFQPYYFDSVDVLVFGFQNPGVNSAYLGMAGDLVVDANDIAYPATFSMGTGTANNIGANGSSWGWSATSSSYTAGGTNSSPVVRTNYGSANRIYWQAWCSSGSWAAQSTAGSDVLINDAVPASYLVPIPLIGLTKGEGFALRMRQFAMGPSSTGPFATLASSGPVIQARQVNAGVAGNFGCPWLTNFKL